MDRLSQLLQRHPLHARVFFNGDFCDANRFHEDGVSGHLHLVRTGRAEFVHDDGSVLRVEEPALVFYPRGRNHLLRIPDGAGATLLCARIAFGDGAGNPLLRVLPDCMHLPLAAAAGIEETLAFLFREAGQDTPGRDLVLDRLCDILLVQLIRGEFDSGRLSPGLLAGLGDRYLAAALAAIHDRPDEAWTLPALAAEACMSRAAFAAHFSAVLGMPPGEYLGRWRMALAVRLLRQGVPVKLVSMRTGFTSPSTFTRAFTARMGASPRAWLGRTV